RLREGDAERARRSDARRIGDGEAEAVVVVRAVVRVGHLAGVDVVLAERAIYVERHVAQLQRAVRRRGRDRVNDFARRIAGVGAGGELCARDGDGRAFRNAGSPDTALFRSRLREGDAERARRSDARRIGDGEAEAVVVVRAVVRVSDL